MPQDGVIRVETFCVPRHCDTAHRRRADRRTVAAPARSSADAGTEGAR